MANRRMFSKQITDSDSFVEMPLSSQALYFHLGIAADDDGFISPQRVMRGINANKNDLDVLIAKKFCIMFEDWVIVITHRKSNNVLRSDRYTPTLYQEHYNKLKLETGRYQMTTIGIPNDIPLVCVVEDSIGKFSKGEDSIPKGIDNELSTTPIPNFSSEANASTWKQNEALAWIIIETTGFEEWDPPPPPTPSSEIVTFYGREDIAQVIMIMRRWCEEVGLQYMEWYKERQFAKHMLSKKFAKEIEKYNMPFEEFVTKIIKLSAKPFMKKVNTPIDFYQNRWHVLNANIIEFNSKKEKERPVYVVNSKVE